MSDAVARDGTDTALRGGMTDRTVASIGIFAKLLPLVRAAARDGGINFED